MRDHPLMPLPDAGLLPYERQQLERLQAWCGESPGPAARGFAHFSAPATRMMQNLIPVRAFRSALDLAHDTGKRFADQQSVLKLAGAESLDALRQRDLASLDLLAARLRKRATLAAGASGMLFGVAGAAGLVADVPALLVLALRSIQRVGMAYGQPPGLAAEDRLAIGIFALASANTMAEKQAALRALAHSPQDVLLRDAAWRDGIERAAERELAKEAAVLSLNNLARQMAANLGWRKSSGALPLIGAAVGGSVNAWYLHDVTTTAQYCFQARWLAARYPQLAAGTSRAVTERG